MSRLGVKIGLVAIAVLLIAAATIGTVSAADVTLTFHNNVTNKDIAALIIKDVDNNTAMTPDGFLNVTYRDTFEIEVNFVHSIVKDGKIDILIYRGSDLIATFSDKKVGDVISVDTESYSMLPAWYTIKVRYTNDTSGVVYTLSSETNISTFGYKSIYLSVDPSEYEKPIIDYEIKNPSNKIPVGDKLRIKVKVWGKDRFTWWFKRWEDKKGVGSYQGHVWDTVSGSLNRVSKTIEIDTLWLFNNTTLNADTGKYVIKLKAGETTESVEIEFVKPAITELKVNKPEIVPEDTLKITGTVNVVKTGDDADDHGNNYVYLILLNTTTFGKDDLKLDTSGNFYISNKIIGNLTGVQPRPTVTIDSTTYRYFFARATVYSDGSFEKSIKLTNVKKNEDWTILAAVTTVTNTTDLGKLSNNLQENGKVKSKLLGKAVLSFRVVEPKIEFTMNVTKFARGEDFKVTGKTNLPEGSTIYVVFENADNFEVKTGNWDGDARRGVTEGKFVKTTVGADGSFETVKIKVKSDASLTTYKVYAVWLSGGKTPAVDKSEWDVYATLTITVTKHKLEAYISPTIATPDEKVKIYGNTTADKVYIFTDEADILEGVAKKTDTNLLNPSVTASITVSEGKFSKEFKVITDTEGTYMVYVFAPANTSKIDESTDAQVILALQVVAVKYNESTLPSVVKMVRGQKAHVKFRVMGGSDTMKKVDVYVTLKGHGISVDKVDGQNDHFSPDSDGWVEFDVYPYYNKTYSALSDKSAYNKTLMAGEYTLKLKLYYNGSLVDDGVREIPFKVEAPILNVTVPSEVPKGETLKVTVNTNRAGGYDHLWVVLKVGMKTYKQKITTNENGTAVAEFETVGFAEGTTCKVYVRDTLGTYTGTDESDWIEQWYDLSPTDPSAKAYRGDDDVLWPGTEGYVVTITKPVATTTTAVTTTTTPVATTTTPVATTTTPVTNVTAVTTTTTTTTAVTTTTTPKKPTPGFEAIFAIAGLIAVAYLLRRR